VCVLAFLYVFSFNCVPSFNIIWLKFKKSGMNVIPFMGNQTSRIWTIISENRVANTQIYDVTVTLRIVTMDGSRPSDNMHIVISVYS